MENVAPHQGAVPLVTSVVMMGLETAAPITNSVVGQAAATGMTLAVPMEGLNETSVSLLIIPLIPLELLKLCRGR